MLKEPERARPPWLVKYIGETVYPAKPLIHSFAAKITHALRIHHVRMYHGQTTKYDADDIMIHLGPLVVRHVLGPGGVCCRVPTCFVCVSESCNGEIFGACGVSTRWVVIYMYSVLV